MLSNIFSLLLLGTSVQAGNECQPWRWDKNGHPLQGNWNYPIHHDNKRSAQGDNDDGPAEPPARLKPGDVNCRGAFATREAVNYATCAELAQFGGISIDKFFLLNPTLKKDCSNITPTTQYCIRGYLEPLRAWDGKCGPPNKNATCSGTDLGCCNSKTWACGESDDDCAPGVCFEGDCEGDDIWSTDGTCGGTSAGPRACTGPWGDCCNLEGKCGTGIDFCGAGHCQYGNCTVTTTRQPVIVNTGPATATPTPTWSYPLSSSTLALVSSST